MKTVIVLAMHGAPPRDFPEREMGEFFGLHARLEHATGPELAGLERRYAELEAKMRAWPRTPENDRFWAASHELADDLTRIVGAEVIVGFNEFCGPDLDEALEKAIAGDADQIVVVTPMMMRGGQHAEVDIPAAISRVQERHPSVSISFVWPFDSVEVADFLAEQVRRAIQ